MAPASRQQSTSNRLYGRVLIVNDGANGGQPALNIALSLAAMFGAELHFLMVGTLPSPATTIAEVDEEKALLERRFEFLTAAASRRARESHVAFEAELVLSRPFERILEHLARSRIDLLILGRLRGPVIGNLLLGDLRERLARAAPCAVHLVK